jgi:hypothetical protein
MAMPLAFAIPTALEMANLKRGGKIFLQ